MRELRGIFPILNTPFDENNEVDKEDMLRQIQYAIERSPHGLGVNGEASENYNLSCDERKRILGWVLSETNGRIPIVVGVGANNTEDSVVLARHASEKGVDAVFASPLIGGETTPEAIYAHFKAINDAVEIPVIIQEHSVIMPNTLIKRMVEELQNVKYVKEERPQNMGQKITEVLSITGKVQVFCIGVQIIDELQRGAIGIMPSCVGLASYVKIFNSYMAGDVETAWAEWLRIEPLITYRRLLNSFLVAKEVLRCKGVFKNIRMRDLGTAMDDGEIKMLHELMERVGSPV